jgi:hypothetical protein
MVMDLIEWLFIRDEKGRKYIEIIYIYIYFFFFQVRGF